MFITEKNYNLSRFALELSKKFMFKRYFSQKSLLFVSRLLFSDKVSCSLLKMAAGCFHIWGRSIFFIPVHVCTYIISIVPT